MSQFEIVVIGAGLAGSIAAIALARGGRKVAIVAPKRKASDQRTTALMDQSIRFLDRLGLWDDIKPSASRLSTMQIIDGTKRLFRAPPVAFRSSEIGLDAFGYNIPNEPLLAALEKAIAAEANITVIGDAADDIHIDADNVTVTFSGGKTLEASFVIGADGKNSMTRKSAGIDVKTWSYPQTALVMNFTHSRPHQNTSTEFHTDSGPFTQVPLSGNRSSLVWVCRPRDAETLTALPLEELSRLVEQRSESILGKVEVEDSVQAWPLSGMTATRYGAGRCALIGEAAHAFPPIGAQGLNLSLRDVAALEDLLCRNTGQPIDPRAGDSFDRRRKVDVLSRTASVDLLNRSLLSGLLPVQMMRAAGLHLLSGIAPLRQMMMREGVAPGMALREFPSVLKEKVRRQ